MPPAWSSQAPSATSLQTPYGKLCRAVGWEWFGLAFGSDGQPLIEWRGLRPPSTETYSAAKATCNDCHADAGDDAVMSPRRADVAG